MQSFDKKATLAFVVGTGIASFFADITYEDVRAISEPFLGLFSAVRRRPSAKVP